MNSTDTVRIDKWLWCARFFKTRSLAAQEIDKGRVAINGQVTKASREVRAGDTVALRQQTLQLFQRRFDAGESIPDRAGEWLEDKRCSGLRLAPVCAGSARATAAGR